MAIDLYHKSSFLISKLITSNYSTSFSLGIRAFPHEVRHAIYAVYGYVRLADEIVDSFHGHDKSLLLNNFRNETFAAIKAGISTNPVIHSFQKTVNAYNIDLIYIEQFLQSMEMDLHNNYYEKDKFDNYIYGSAEVVGLMCLAVFINGNKQAFDNLLIYAKALGAAFQKVNFLRDMKSDFSERGRIYLPGVSDKFNINDKHKRLLESEIESDFNMALEGIKKLPDGVKLGIYSAYLYYYFLFRKIKKTKVDTLLNKRVRISDFTKLLLLIRSSLEVKFQRIN
jgi:15-cis-phytoene synthase